MLDVERKLRVLVVDDCGDTAEGIATLLAMFGQAPRTARTGFEAIALARSFEPELVLLDIALPDLSGYDVARELRRSHPRSYLVALTGHVRAADRERAYRSGFDVHVAKPIGADSLMVLVEVARREASCRPSASRSRAAATYSTTSDPT